MIGVLAKSNETAAAEEFFELFKTPWEFFRPGTRYDVLLCTSQAPPPEWNAECVIIYGSQETDSDIGPTASQDAAGIGKPFLFQNIRIPIYGRSLTFSNTCKPFITDPTAGKSCAYLTWIQERPVVRVGYDLFEEVGALLIGGQPPTNARIPTLELHIELLRTFINRCGVPVLEVPPIPGGHSFIVCLTHDVDFGGIRNYTFGRTLAGFVYRATFGSLRELLHGRGSIRSVWTNLIALAKLPFVHLGLAGDFWGKFDQDYLRLEQGRPSTFFFIPFANRAGKSPAGLVARARATRYDVTTLAPEIARLLSSGCEVALHGIDAWRETAAAQDEGHLLRSLCGREQIGVRMHWLYWNECSAKILENAAFAYDSTAGYNEAVGYKMGTLQVFKHLHAERLLELPIHVMDTSLFSASYLGCSNDEAWAVVEPVFLNASRYGGVLTINWHDRSLAPERLWGDFYAGVINRLTHDGAWFATAHQAVSWFSKRRSVRFVKADSAEGISIKVPQARENLPCLRLRFYPARSTDDQPQNLESSYSELALDADAEVSFDKKSLRRV